MTSSTWSPLGSVAPRELSAARLTLHYAAQPLAAAAYAVLPMRDDHSHTNLLWSAARQGFVGRPLSSERRLFLDPSALRIGLLDPAGDEAANVELNGKTLAQAFSELGALLRLSGEEVPDAGLELPDYDLPDSPLADAATFSADAAALAELTRWYHDADQALAPVARDLLDEAELRTWPHHFDSAALLSLDPGADAEDARSVNAGFSPGDGSYDEPYFYVSPWPYPDADALPELPDGAHWHTEGFTAAVLPGSAITATKDGAAQERRVRDTLRAAIEGSRSLLGN